MVVEETALKWQYERDSAQIRSPHEGPSCAKSWHFLVLLSLSLYPLALRAQTTNASIAGQVEDVKTLYSKKWMPVDPMLASLLQRPYVFHECHPGLRLP